MAPLALDLAQHSHCCFSAFLQSCIVKTTAFLAAPNCIFICSVLLCAFTFNMEVSAFILLVNLDTIVQNTDSQLAQMLCKAIVMKVPADVVECLLLSLAAVLQAV